MMHISEQSPDIQLTDTQREVLGAIVALFQEDGVSPTPKRIHGRLGRDVRSAIRSLKDLGYVCVPYKAGPVRVLKDLDGREVKAIFAHTGIAPAQTKLIP